MSRTSRSICVGLSVTSCRMLAALLLALATPALASTDPASLLLLVDYVGVDYPGAVSAGEIVNDAEYAEMQEFGEVSISPIPVPRIEVLGVYPSLESLSAQVLLGLVAFGLVWRTRRHERADA